jgi:hypothetical protein
VSIGDNPPTLETTCTYVRPRTCTEGFMIMSTSLRAKLKARHVSLGDDRCRGHDRDIMPRVRFLLSNART